MKAHKYIATTATTIIQSGPGVLRDVIITGGTKGTIDIYNDITATGTPVASYDSNLEFGSYTFDIAMSKGITVVTGAATKMTITY